MDFPALQHLPASRVHWSGGVPHPPSFRLQGLSTLLTGCSSRCLVGLVSYPQHSWASPLRSVHLTRRYHHVTAVIGPPAVDLASDAATEVPARRCSPQLLGLDPPGEAPGLHGAETPPHRVAPMGFSLPGLYRPLTLIPPRESSSLAIVRRRPPGCRIRPVLCFRVSIGQRLEAWTTVASRSLPQPS
jgi:hypothetical protein